MTDPRLAHATPWGRMYARDLHSEPAVPSITTVIGMAPDLPAPTAKPPAIGTRAHVGALTGWRMRIVQDATAAYLRNSDELYHRFPHIPAAVTAAREAGRNTEAQARAARNAIAATPDVVADAAAQRGDRVHEFAEALGQWQLGIVAPDTVARARATLDEHGDGSYADVLVDWWARWRIKAVANEVTVWNSEREVAGTLDIVFRVEGRLCVGDFKSKDDRNGQSKPMSTKVGMQLLNALHADEEIVDPATGTWQPWRFYKPDHLVAIAVSPTEVVPKLINPAIYGAQWARFCHLRDMWQDYRDGTEGSVLMPARPPASASAWPDGELASLPDGIGAPQAATVGG